MRCIAAALAVWLCAAVPAFAQDVAQLPLVGVLRINTAANNETAMTGLRNALAALGDIDGKTIRLDIRLAEGDAGRFPELAAALVRDIPHAGERIKRGAPVCTLVSATESEPVIAALGARLLAALPDSVLVGD